MNGFYYVWFHAMCVALPASQDDPTDDAAGLGGLILILDATSFGLVAESIRQFRHTYCFDVDLEIRI